MQLQMLSTSNEMVAPALVEPKIDEGAKLIRQLDEAAFPVSAALWFYEEESGEWRLIIATPKYDELGVRDTLRLIQQVLVPRRGVFDLPNIIVTSPGSRLIAGLRERLKSSADVLGTRVAGQVVGDTYVSDAYIYRV
jgi:hypothetical protein